MHLKSRVDGFLFNLLDKILVRPFFVLCNRSNPKGTSIFVFIFAMNCFDRLDIDEVVEFIEFGREFELAEEAERVPFPKRARFADLDNILLGTAGLL